VECKEGPLPQKQPLFKGWQVKDSNLRRRKPTDLQSAPIGRSGNRPLTDRGQREQDS
jgi:hypothetical protein